MKRAELTLLSLFLLLAATGFGLDRFIGERPLRPSAPSGRTISEAVYCPAPEAAEATMATGNYGGGPLTLRRAAIGGNAESSARSSILPGGRRVSLMLSDLGISRSFGLVESFGGAAITDLQVADRERGLTASACSARPGGRWLFASASTTRRHDHFLMVANPFQEEAVVNVRVLAADKDFVPVLLRERVIPPLSQEPLLLADFIPEAGSFGLDVAATQGRVVISQFAQIATREGLRGISLGVGAEAASTTWLFAGGEAPADGEESIVLVNPTDSEALVEVAFPTEKQTIAPDALREVPVPAGRQVAIKAADFVPRGTKHSVRVISTNDVPVVAERTTVAAVPGGRGYESVPGVARGARRWAISAGALPAAQESLAIVGAGGSPVAVKVTVVTDKGRTAAAMPGLKAFADRRTTVDLEPLLAGGAATFILEASAPFAVESAAVAGAPYSDFGGAPGTPVD